MYASTAYINQTHKTIAELNLNLQSMTGINTQQQSLMAVP